MGVCWAGQPSWALCHHPLGLVFIPTVSQGAGLFHLETCSATAASFSQSICRKGPASASAPEMLDTSSFTNSCVTLRLCSWDGTNWMPRAGRGSSQPRHRHPGEPHGGTVSTRWQPSLLSFWDAVQLHLRILYSCLLAHGMLLFFLDLLG